MRRQLFSSMAGRLASLCMRHGKQLWRSDRGVAAIETALVLPLMIFIIIGTIEVYQYFRAATILDRSAFTLANGISIQRELLDRGRCTEANDICTYGAIAHDLMTPLDFAGRGSVVFSVYAATDPSGNRPPPVSWEKAPTWTRGLRPGHTKPCGKGDQSTRSSCRLPPTQSRRYRARRGGLLRL